KVEPGQIPPPRHVGRGDAGGDAGVQEPRAIHMGGETSGPCNLYHLIKISLLPDRAATDVGGLLDADDRLRWLVTAARVKRGAKSVGRKLSVGGPLRGRRGT